MHRIDCLASHGDLGIHEFLLDALRHTPPEQIRPQALLNGHDLQQMGYLPGPKFKQILSAVEDAQLEGNISSREQAEDLVRREFPL